MAIVARLYLVSGSSFPRPSVEHSAIWLDHEAVRVAYARQRGMPDPIRKGTEGRHYDFPLHQSCRFCAETDHQIQTYNTVHFWLALGEMLNSRDDVAFLHDIWTDIGADPYAAPSSPPLLVYPDDGSTYNLRGWSSFRPCEVNRTDICLYNAVAQVFSARPHPLRAKGKMTAATS